MDTVVELIPSVEEVIASSSDLIAQVQGLEALEREYANLETLIACVEAYGLNSGLVGFVNRLTQRQLLDGAALEALQLGTDQAALEGIGDALRNTLSKIVERAAAFGQMAAKTVRTLGASIGEKLTAFSTSIRGKVFQGGTTIRAHSAKTCQAVIAAFSGAADAIAAVWHDGVARTTDELKKLREKAAGIVARIKMPGRSVVVTEDGAKVTKTEEIAPVSGTADQLGWSITSINGLVTKMRQVIGTVFHKITDAISTGVRKVASAKPVAGTEKIEANLHSRGVTVKVTLKGTSFSIRFSMAVIKGVILAGVALIAYAVGNIGGAFV